MHLKQALHQGQPNSQSSPRLFQCPICLGEQVKDARKHVRGNAQAVITHADDGLCSLLLGRKPDVPPVRRVLGSVIQEIGDDLGQPNRIRLQPHRLRRQGFDQLVFAGPDKRVAILHGTLDDLGQLDRCLDQFYLPPADAGDFQQIVHQPGHLLGLTIDDIPCPPAVRLRGAVKAKELNGTSNGSKRIAQLMAQYGQELVLSAVGLRQLVGMQLQLALQAQPLHDFKLKLFPFLESFQGLGFGLALGAPRGVTENADYRADKNKAGQIEPMDGKGNAQRAARRNEEIIRCDATANDGQKGRAEAAIPGYRSHGDIKRGEWVVVPENRIQEHPGCQCGRAAEQGGAITGQQGAMGQTHGLPPAASNSPGNKVASWPPDFFTRLEPETVGLFYTCPAKLSVASLLLKGQARFSRQFATYWPS